MGGVKVSGGKGHQDQGKVRKGRGAHFLTGIRPSWFTCSFSFVYLGRQAEGSCPGDGHLHPHPPRQAWGSRFAQEGVPRGVLSQDVHGQLEQLLSPDLRVRMQGERVSGAGGAGAAPARVRNQVGYTVSAHILLCQRTVRIRGREQPGIQQALTKGRLTRLLGW